MVKGIAQMKHLMRSRANPHIRELLAQDGLTISKLIQPLFVVEGLTGEEEIPALLDNFRMGIDAALRQIENDLNNNVRNFMLFNIPANKDISADFGAKTIKAIKDRFGADIHLWVDTCLCSSSVDGHCCIFHKDQSTKIDLDASLKAIAYYALCYADAGADGIAPSDMMDGRVGDIRKTLDKNGHANIAIMSYSTKFASEFYGPFRGAADSVPAFGDRRQYQIDVRNRDDAINSSLRCSKEGADMLMLKPGMTSIDLVAPIHEKSGLPVGVYQVSGEYASIALLAREGLIDFDKALLETWQVFWRSGAQFIITYGARKAHKLGVTKT
ncbi:MAG: porphobilinogen synthase [Devosiaceae bacterium]|nr:porphobilinogen synthase [Devosiaceae bacterium]